MSGSVFFVKSRAGTQPNFDALNNCISLEVSTRATSTRTFWSILLYLFKAKYFSVMVLYFFGGRTAENTLELVFSNFLLLSSSSTSFVVDLSLVLVALLLFSLLVLLLL
eukprot:jgi/Orpsp1_1/1187860/evm.model.d7180000060759.1